MSTFWIIYWITWGAIIFFTAFISVFFELDCDNIPIAYILLADILGAIPIANWLISIALIILVIEGICKGDLEPKELNTKNNE